MSTSTQPCKDSGFALVSIILIALLISVISMAIMFAARRQAALARELTHHNRAALAAYSAYNLALFNFLQARLTSTGMRFKENGKGPEVSWNLYNEPVRLEPGVEIRFQDAAGLVSPLFQSKLLSRLLLQVTGDQNRTRRIIDSLADWQDRNDLKKLNGAEAADYRLNRAGYEPRNFYIQLPQELCLLPGCDAELYGKIKKYIVYWQPNPPNYLTMSGELLQACLKNSSLVERIIKLRRQNKLTAGIFFAMTGIKQNEDFTGRPSGWVRLRVEAREEAAVARISALIVRRQQLDRPCMVIEWKS